MLDCAQGDESPTQAHVGVGRRVALFLHVSLLDDSGIVHARLFLRAARLYVRLFSVDALLVAHLYLSLDLALGDFLLRRGYTAGLRVTHVQLGGACMRGV